MLNNKTALTIMWGIAIFIAIYLSYGVYMGEKAMRVLAP